VEPTKEPSNGTIQTAQYNLEDDRERFLHQTFADGA
jgi:hypothetical protein